MRIKLPFTDQFLWDLYKILEKGGDLYEFSRIPTMKEAVYPELRKIRRLYEKKRGRRNFRQFIYYLKKRGYIQIKNLQGIEGVILTKRGFEHVWKTKLVAIERKKRRDRRWQMVIFDIPEKQRKLRDILRENLLLLDYRMLQRSVWVCPYDVLKETEEVVRRYVLDSYVKVFLIKEVEV